MWKFMRAPVWALVILLAALAVGCKETSHTEEAKAAIKQFEAAMGALTLEDSSCTKPGEVGECASIALADNYAIKGLFCGVDLKCHVSPGYCQIDGEGVWDCSAMYDYTCSNDQNSKDYVAAIMGGNPCVEPKCAFVLPDPADPKKTSKTMGIMNFPPRKKGATGYPAPFTTGQGACGCTEELCSADGTWSPDKKCTPPSKGTETCNGKDDDCNGQTDEENASGCTKFYPDLDSDTYGSGSGKCYCAIEGTYTVKVGGDCDDANKDVSPKGVEACNGKDDNCDGSTDPMDAAGCTKFYKDVDGDAYGINDNQCLCAGAGQYVAAQNGDCDDANKDVSPKGIETCNSKDDNCSGATDETDAGGCKVYYTDSDGDTYGVSPSACMCAPSITMTAVAAGDCSDANKDINPKGIEVCDGKDNDCDGIADEEGAGSCTDFYLDGDGDGYGAGTPKCLCGPTIEYPATQAGDCDDTKSASNPKAVEKCDGEDNNCDKKADEGNVCLCNDALQVDVLDKHNSAANAMVVDIDTTNAVPKAKLVLNWICADGSTFTDAVGAEFSVRPMASTSHVVYAQFVPDKTKTPTGSFKTTLQSVSSCGPNVDSDKDGVNETVDANICVASTPLVMAISGTGKYDVQLTIDGKKTLSGLNPNGVLVGKLKIWKSLK